MLQDIEDRRFQSFYLSGVPEGLPSGRTVQPTPVRTIGGWSGQGAVVFVVHERECGALAQPQVLSRGGRGAPSR